MTKKERNKLARRTASALWRKILEFEGRRVSCRTRGKIGEAYRKLCDAHWAAAEAAEKS
jgi:hypothetical protein